MRFKLDWDVISKMTEPIINDSSGTSKKCEYLLNVHTFKKMFPILSLYIYMSN